MKNKLLDRKRLLQLFYCFTIMLLFANAAVAQDTFTWNGSSSNDWATGANWTKTGTIGTDTYPGETRTVDLVVVNKNDTPFAPIIASGSYGIARVTINDAFGTTAGATLTINSGATLTVSATTVTCVILNGGNLVNNGTLNISSTAQGSNGFLTTAITCGTPTVVPASVTEYGYSGSGALNINISAATFANSAAVAVTALNANSIYKMLFNGATSISLGTASVSYAFRTAGGAAASPLIIGGDGFTMGSIGSPARGGLLSFGAQSTVTVNAGTTLTLYSANTNVSRGITSFSGSSVATNFINKGTINLLGATTQSGLYFSTGASASVIPFNITNEGTLNVDMNISTVGHASLATGNGGGAGASGTAVNINNLGTLTLKNNSTTVGTGQAIFGSAAGEAPPMIITNSGTLNLEGSVYNYGSKTTIINNGTLNSNNEFRSFTAITNNSGSTINFVRTAATATTRQVVFNGLTFASAAGVGTTYTDSNANTFAVINQKFTSATVGTTLTTNVLSGSVIAPSGTLTKTGAGNGDATITYSSVTVPALNNALSSLTTNSGTVNTDTSTNLNIISGVTAASAGLIAPGGGSGKGIADFSNASSPAIASTLRLQVAGSATAGVDFDQITNSATGGGFDITNAILDVTGIYTPVAPTTIDILTTNATGTLTGDFATVSGLTAGWAKVTTNGTAGKVQLVYTSAATPPTITQLTSDGSTVITQGCGGSTLVIKGTDFIGATAVTVNGVNVASFVITDATTLTVVLPSGATVGVVEVTTTGGTGTSAGNFTVLTNPGSQPANVNCWDNYQLVNCVWVNTGIQPSQPTVVNCWDNFVFNTGTCSWDNTGTQAAQPTTACYETVAFNTTTCVWDVTGTQPVQPATACYETATFNTTTCVWEVTGTQPAAPTGLACYETANFNTTTCVWDVTGTPTTPTTVGSVTQSQVGGSYTWPANGQTYTVSGIYTYVTGCNTATLNLTISAGQPGNNDDGGILEGQDPPTITQLSSDGNNTITQACAGSTLVILGANFTGATGVTVNGVALTGVIVVSFTEINAVLPAGATNGLVAVTTPKGTGLSAGSFTVVANETPIFTTVAAICSGGSLLALPTISNNGITGTWSPALDNTTTTLYTFTPTAGQCATSATMTITVNAVPTVPTTACYESATFNTTTCVWEVTGTQPLAPTGLACYETANFNTTTCAWVVSGTQPLAPTGLACYESATFNTTTCVWEVTGTQPLAPTGLACYESANFNTTTCAWVVSGTQPLAPTGLACYETTNFNTTTCAWVVSGTQPLAPTGLACYETTNFNTTTCAWVVSGTQPLAPTGLACYETANFNTTTCVWVVSGTQPLAPTGLACYETANFNTTTCAWVVSGTQPLAPTGLACYETANFNTTTCAWVVSGTQPLAPTGLACYETANFNTTTCAWVVSGTQPLAPTGLACYETANFNTTNCAWVVSGTQPSAPTGLACYESANFNTTTCAWDVSGTQPLAPTGLACYESANFNTTTCAWDVTGTQPLAPTVLCYQTATWNGTTCQYDVTGTPNTVGSVTQSQVGGSYTWPANGVTYYSSTIDTFVSGCNIATLNLTITPIATTTWDGSAWSNNAPTASVEAIIAGDYNTNANGAIAAKKLTVNSGVLTVNSGNLTLQDALINNAGVNAVVFENNANLIQVNNATNVGAITVKRNSSALKLLDYTLWSSPVTNQNLLAFSPETVLDRFYTYNTTINLYNALPSPATTNFTVGKGYLIRMPSTASPSTDTAYPGVFTGTPNNGIISHTMTVGASGYNFNAVGNPYPSPISMTQFVSDNSAKITGALYFWRKTNGVNGGAYCTWNNGTFVTNNNMQSFDPLGIIQTGQGFIVEASSAATDLMFNNGQRVANNAGQFFKTRQVVENNRIWLNAIGETGDFAQMAINYVTGAIQDLDAFDAKYFNDGTLALNSVLDNTDYVIQGRALPFDGTDEVPLSFKTGAAGNYTIAIDHVDGLFSGNQDIILKDNVAGIEANLKAGAYVFAAEAGANNSRFVLKYQKALGTGSPAFTEGSVLVNTNKGIIHINSGGINMNNVQLFDISGRLVFKNENINKSETTIDASKFANQVLIIKITSDDKKVVSKKVVN